MTVWHRLGGWVRVRLPSPGQWVFNTCWSDLGMITERDRTGGWVAGQRGKRMM